MRAFVLASLAAILALFAVASIAHGNLVEGGPDSLSQARTLADVIDSAGGAPVHVIYVHGMRAEGPGASQLMRERLGPFVGIEKGTELRFTRYYLDVGQWPANAKVGAVTIWRSPSEWQASRPFVDRHVLRGSRGTVVVDEVNWWPLLFPLKCRFLLVPEHDLSGNDVAHLRLCAMGKAPYYPWIPPGELTELIESRPRSGGGAWPNSTLKRQVINWGMSDALIALRPLREYMRETMNGAFDYASAGASRRDQYLVAAESLGSFVVLDAFQSGPENVRAVLERTHDLYFFANQFALLDLARVKGVPGETAVPTTGGIPAVEEDGSALDALQGWAQSPAAVEATGSRAVKQIIAFSDPSDMLTYRVPKISGAIVVNVYVPETGGPFKLFANPVRAHRGHITSKMVWRYLLGRTPSKAKRR